MPQIGVKLNNRSKQLIGEKLNAMAKTIGQKVLPRSQGKANRPDSSGHGIPNDGNTPEVANMPVGLKASALSSAKPPSIEKSHRGHVTDRFD